MNNYVIPNINLQQIIEEMNTQKIFDIKVKCFQKYSLALLISYDLDVLEIDIVVKPAPTHSEIRLTSNDWKIYASALEETSNLKLQLEHLYKSHMEKERGIKIAN